MIKIAIALTSDGKHHTRTTIALMKLHTYITNNYGAPYIPFSFGRVETSSNLIVDLMEKKGDVTHILFVDADADFPEDAIKYLVDADKDIIGCNAAMKKSGDPVLTKDIDGKELNYIKDDIKQVEWIGMHLTLIKMSVFKTIGQPVFYAKPAPGNPKVNSQDVTFCKNAWYGHNIPTYSHLQLSMSVGHVVWRDTVAYLEPHIRKQIEAAQKELKK